MTFRGWSAVAVVAGLGACGSLKGQNSFTKSWFDRSDKMKASQPHWLTPLVTITPRLEQEFRQDFVVRQEPGVGQVVNYGNSKGLEIIPIDRLQLTFNLPPYIQH